MLSWHRIKATFFPCPFLWEVSAPYVYLRGRFDLISRVHYCLHVTLLLLPLASGFIQLISMALSILGRGACQFIVCILCFGQVTQSL